jgi:NADH:ubiquinone oxidoreductase subunit 3 (subunit A)
MLEILLPAILAFVLILITTLAIYYLGKRSAPKTVISENEQAAYACGEKVTFQGLKINVSLYKYLIYFVIFDASVLVLAFAVLNFTASPLLLVFYLGIILAAGLVLVDGGNDE